MAARPLALPEIFTAEGRQGFSDWVDHFESIAEVNEGAQQLRRNGSGHDSLDERRQL